MVAFNSLGNGNASSGKSCIKTDYTGVGYVGV